MNNKPILIDLGTVRIREYNEMNVIIERQEEVFVPTTGRKELKWRFKGYSSTILSALKSIVKNEWLVNKNIQMGLENYLKQIEQSNAKIIEVLKEMEVHVSNR